jgi:hypothetical protein
MLAAALAFGLGWQPMSTRAGTLTNNSNTSNTATVTVDYTLTSSSAIAAPTGSKPATGANNPPAPEITAVVNPVGVVPPPRGSITGPLTILPGSSGFDTQNLAVYLGNFPSDPNAAITSQALGLSFYGRGLAAGGVLNFALTIDKSLANNPPQLLVDPRLTSGISIKLDGVEHSSPTPSTSGSPTPDAGGAKVPEPLSMMVWSILGAAGLLRSGLGRRRASSRDRWSLVRGR